MRPLLDWAVVYVSFSFFEYFRPCKILDSFNVVISLAYISCMRVVAVFLLNS